MEPNFIHRTAPIYVSQIPPSTSKIGKSKRATQDWIIAMMDRFIQTWQIHRAALNRLPVKNENWEY